ncbi:MAG: hypothetical protein H0Z24_05990 [Thermosipho sp. (in: Bacteria)]|nr:hypothetical protein [Thermosipho sp. (in: thermotogales)]
MNLKVGDIVFIKPKGFISTLIAKLTKSEYSHVAIIYSTNNPPSILDATWEGTKIRPLSYYDDRGYDIYRLKEELNNFDEFLIRNWILNNIDVKYDYIQLVSFLNRIIFHVNKIFNNPDKFVCSEMVDRLYKHLGIDLVPQYKDGNVTPEDLKNSPLLIKI